ncbi:PqqD family protein [Microbacterium sp. A8/3-1]|uniref:PqqD family protein n=1 Tax=Microbacterium sp. A8/3-1 TaxID=3160749 RepID=A0AAU7W1S7_9MICO
MPITQNSIPTRQFDVRARTLAGRQLLLRVHVTMETNDVGLAMWSLLDGTLTVGEVAEAVAHEYDVSPEETLADAIAFVKALVEIRFVTMADSDG